LKLINEGVVAYFQLELENMGVGASHQMELIKPKG